MKCVKHVTILCFFGRINRRAAEYAEFKQSTHAFDSQVAGILQKFSRELAALCAITVNFLRNLPHATPFHFAQ